MKTHFLFNNNVRGRRRWQTSNWYREKLNPVSLGRSTNSNWIQIFIGVVSSKPYSTFSLKHHCSDEVLRFCFEFSSLGIGMDIPFAFPELLSILPHLTVYSWRLSRHGLHQQVLLPVSFGWIWTVGCTGRGRRAEESPGYLLFLPGHGLAVAVFLSLRSHLLSSHLQLHLELLPARSNCPFPCLYRLRNGKDPPCCLPWVYYFP